MTATSETPTAASEAIVLATYECDEGERQLVGVPTTSLRETTPSVSRRRGQRRAAAQARGEGPRQALEPRVPARLGRRRGSHVPRGLHRSGTCGRERALSALQRLPAQSSSD